MQTLFNGSFCDLKKICVVFVTGNRTEDNGRAENGQHPSISRRSLLFDVQIFTVAHGAYLRGNRRCVGVLFASRMPHASSRKFKATSRVAQRPFSRKRRIYLEVTERFPSPGTRYPVRGVKRHETSSRLPPSNRFSKKISPIYFRSMNPTNPVPAGRGKDTRSLVHAEITRGEKNIFLERSFIRRIQYHRR